MAGSWASMPIGRRSPASRPASDRGSATGSSCARPTSGSSRTVAPTPASAPVDGCLFDLGLSSFQLADRERGFGFRAGGPLDMRFDPSRGVPAAELLATLDAAELTALFRRYGEEPKAPRIARAIVEARRAPRSRPPRSWPRWSSGSLPPNPRRRRRTHPGDARLPGAPDRGQRGARCARGGPGGRARPAPARRAARGPELPLARGPDRQAVLPGRTAGLRLPAARCPSASAARTRGSAS